jgi:hypothetical protein
MGLAVMSPLFETLGPVTTSEVLVWGFTKEWEL